MSFLDVAGATGDVAAGAQSVLKQAGIALDYAIADRSPGHLDTTQKVFAADAFHLPFDDNSFDVTGSALFIHHLEPDQIVPLINESLRVCKHACLINDLQRNFFHLLTAQAGRVLYKSRITVHDAAASVRRAYTETELRTILGKVSASRMDFSRHFFFRMGVILWKE